MVKIGHWVNMCCGAGKTDKLMTFAASGSGQASVFKLPVGMHNFFGSCRKLPEIQF